MKVAWFGHKTRKRGNGLVNYSKQLREGLEARGAQVIFFYHGPKDEKMERRAGQTRLGSFSVWDHDLITSPRARGLIERSLADEDVDIAHVSLSFSHLDFLLPQLCHSLGIPIVATFHAPYDRRLSVWGIASRLLYRVWSTALAKYDAIVIFSHEQSDILARYGVPTDRIHVIPNGVDTEAFCPAPSTFKKEVDAELLVVYCGRLDPEKNVDALLRVYQSLQLPASHKVVIVGNGVEYQKLRNRYSSEAVIFTGLVTNRDDLIRILQAGDIFALPSNVEGLSLAMLEGMACGIATIATDVGCDGEALRGAGIVIDPENLESQLRLALDVLVENSALRRSLGEKARHRVTTVYSLERNIDAVVELYQQLLDRAAGLTRLASPLATQRERVDET